MLDNAWRSLPDSAIIDTIGALKAKRDDLDDLIKAMGAELLKRGCQNGAAGSFFECSVIAEHFQWKLDRKKLERDKGEAFVRPYLTHSKVAAYIKVTPRTAAAARAVERQVRTMAAE